MLAWLVGVVGLGEDFSRFRRALPRFCGESPGDVLLAPIVYTIRVQ